LRRGLEHGHATSLHEYDLLPDGQLGDYRLSDIWILRHQWHGDLYLVHGRILLQCDEAVGRVGRLLGWILLPDRVDLDYPAHMQEDQLLSRNEPE
jgi:hypothetical protein